MIHLKKDHEIAAMRLAGGVSSTVLREAAAFVQPGGSIRDEAVVGAVDAAGAAMVFTGRRHFRH